MKLLSVVFLFFFTFIMLKAQPKNDLVGLYEGSNHYMYNRFEFLGNGKVKVNKDLKGEYYHENDSLFVFVDLELSVYHLEKDEIVGRSVWENEQRLKLQKKSLKNKKYEQGDEQRAIWMKRFNANFSKINLAHSLDRGDLPVFFQKIQNENESLCSEGFDLACIHSFSFTTLQMIQDDTDDQTVNSYYAKLKEIAERVIELNNPDGYGLLYSFYVLKDKQQEGEEFLEKGMSLGSDLCMKISLDKMKSEL